MWGRERARGGRGEEGGKKKRRREEEREARSAHRAYSSSTPPDRDFARGPFRDEDIEKKKRGDTRENR